MQAIESSFTKVTAKWIKSLKHKRTKFPSPKQLLSRYELFLAVANTFCQTFHFIFIQILSLFLP